MYLTISSPPKCSLGAAIPSFCRLLFDFPQTALRKNILLSGEKKPNRKNAFGFGLVFVRVRERTPGSGKAGWLFSGQS